MKKILSYLPSYFLVLLIIGICLQVFFKICRLDHVWLMGVLFILFIGCCVIHVFKKKWLFIMCSSVVFIGIGITAVYIQNTTHYKNHYSHVLEDGAYGTLRITEVLRANAYYYNYNAEVCELNGLQTRGEVLLNIRRDSVKPSELLVDTKLFLKLDINAIQPPINPHQFDYKQYLEHQGVYDQQYTKAGEFKVLSTVPISLSGYAERLRRHLQEALQHYSLSKDAYGMLNALLLGQRQELSKAVLTDYVNAGAIHILAISGLHIGILLVLFTIGLKPLERLPYGRILVTVLIVSLLWLFAIITGLSASVVRAVTMFSFVAVSQRFSYTKRVEQSLITSAFLLLLVNPLWLFSVGFQLSYLAVFGIVWIQPKLYSLLKSRYWLLNKFWSFVTVSIAAQIGVLPLSLYYFHQFPTLFLLSNSIIIPFLGGILVYGILILVLALFQSLPDVLILGFQKLIALMNAVIRWVAHQDRFLLSHISMSLMMMIAWYMVIIMLFQLWNRGEAKRLIYVLISLIGLQCVYIQEKYVRESREAMLIFHKYKGSVIAHRKGTYLEVYANSDTLTNGTDNVLKPYIVNEKLIMTTKGRQNIFQFKDKYVLVVDSLGVYNLPEINPTYIVLQQSPKINLERLINELQPKVIIADGSNFKRYIALWQKSCIQQKTPFHYTGNGAYIIK